MKRNSERDEAAGRWPDNVRVGIFDGMPTPLTWDDADQFVYLLNGYTVMDTDKLGSFANKRLHKARKEGIWRGNARDLWLCLFFEKRRWRHFDSEPAGDDQTLLDGLCESLRQKMTALDATERADLVALMAANPCPWPARIVR
jgi:hypothetical protein